MTAGAAKPGWIALLSIVAALAATPQVAHARTVAVLFRGFLASPPAGMDRLADALESSFGGNPAQPFSSQVFAWTQQQQAFDFIDSFDDIDCLILAGHSFGGNSAIELVTDFLDPAGITVDLLIQFDSVGTSDDVLPSSVVEGINYHQTSTGIFEPQGVASVAGSSNYKVETLYGVGDSDITHTQIDCPLFERNPVDYAALFGTQPDLYERILQRVFEICVLPVPAMQPLASVALVMTLLVSAFRKVLRRPRSVRAGRARAAGLRDDRTSAS